MDWNIVESTVNLWEAYKEGVKRFMYFYPDYSTVELRKIYDDSSRLINDERLVFFATSLSIELLEENVVKYSIEFKDKKVLIMRIGDESYEANYCFFIDGILLDRGNMKLKTFLPKFKKYITNGNKNFNNKNRKRVKFLENF